MGRTTRQVAAAVALALLVGACGGDDDTADAGTTETTEAETASGAVSDIGDVQSATIQVVAQGSFAEPAGSLAAYEEFEGAGSGSGFIIDPSGIAVTNNHVVTGAATLDVFVGGSDEPVNARVLGVSECYDLAVIDLDGDDYPYLDWFDGEVTAGREVRAAGFPLGDPEFTLTSGIVSKARAAGDSSWASVDSVVEHDANIQPGNSGGPLVDVETAQVVGVNYAGGDPGTGTSQFFAIGAALAADMAERLVDGDQLALGVNGQAVIDPGTGVEGIWVSSVDTNSPAGELGLRGGDVIEKLEGLSLGGDGTLKTYCDVLQSHDPADKLAVQVLRFAEDVRLRGEFNGDELTPFESLGLAIQQEAGGGLEEGSEYTDYTTITDDTGAISVEVPSSWTEVDGQSASLEDGTTAPRVAAAPSLGAFVGAWSAPGLNLVGAPVGFDLDELLDGTVGGAAEACTDGGREDYDDGLYTGRIQYWLDCDGTGSVTVGIAAQPADGSFVIAVIVQLASAADAAALDRVIQTFTVDL